MIRCRLCSSQNIGITCKNEILDLKICPDALLNGQNRYSIMMNFSVASFIPRSIPRAWSPGRAIGSVPGISMSRVLSAYKLGVAPHPDQPSLSAAFFLGRMALQRSYHNQ